jgi:2-oxoglutarate dehydrogenase E1 component
MNITDVALVRIEQLYPFPVNFLVTELAKYSKATEWVWVQEEPENMGAWGFLLRKFTNTPELSSYTFRGITRKESSSPATGSSKLHAAQQQEIIQSALVVEKSGSNGRKKLVKQS